MTTTATATRNPLVLSYGMGVDSTAVLVLWWLLGIRPDVILFADTGSEKPETYAYLPVIQAWLARVGFPAIQVVRYRVQKPRNGHYDSLEGNCLVNVTLPSLAFGRKGCSQKWKAEPLDRMAKRLFAAHIAAGGKVDRAIGYDAGPCDEKRGTRESDDGAWHWVYPLREAGWDREECIRQIAAAGLPVPVKSACFFCPATKPAELIQLALQHPDLARRAVAIEDGAQATLRDPTFKGLWGRGLKGKRKGTQPRPGAWREFLTQQGLGHVCPELPSDGCQTDDELRVYEQQEVA